MRLCATGVPVANGIFASETASLGNLKDSADLASSPQQEEDRAERTPGQEDVGGPTRVAPGLVSGRSPEEASSSTTPTGTRNPPASSSRSRRGAPEDPELGEVLDLEADDMALLVHGLI